jgi:AcrR family transcriptional regulator
MAGHEILEAPALAGAGLAVRRMKVIEAMAAVCAEKTYAATTIAEVVARAGISSRTFYKLFTNKRACFDATVDAFVDEAWALATAAGAEADTQAGEVRAAIAAILELAARKPAFAKLAFAESAAVDPTLVDRYWNLFIKGLRARWSGDDGPSPQADADARSAFARAQVLIFDQITAGRTAQLPELLPELVYVALLPFVGQQEALRQAQLGDQPH